MNSVFIFAKPNRMGMSKTRLARQIGVSEARRINAMMTSRVMRASIDPRWQTAIVAAPDDALYTRQPIWPTPLPRLSQGDGNLGDRMRRAFDLAPVGKVIMVGTDMPDLTPGLIWKAIRLLRRHGAVLGPADDGGFWLFGQTKRVNTTPPFEGVRWSTEYTMSDVVRNLGEASIGYLPQLTDIDDAAALRAWMSRS